MDKIYWKSLIKTYKKKIIVVTPRNIHLQDTIGANDAIDIFGNIINSSPELSFEFASKLKGFIRRFVKNLHSERERAWFKDFCASADTDYTGRLYSLLKLFEAKSGAPVHNALVVYVVILIFF